MIIPITYKADGGDSSKKGKIRAEDLSVLNAFCLKKKTGILNMLNRCEAYSITPSSPDAFFYMHSGYVVICGRVHYVEEATQGTITLPVSGTETGYFGIKVDLSASADAEVSLFQKTGTLVQNDLNENPISGVYEFPLYRYTATQNGLTLERVGEFVEPNSEAPALANGAIYTANRDGTVNDGKTIDEKFADVSARLDTLGFKTGGSVTPGAHVTITSQNITRQGKYVIGKIEGRFTITQSQSLSTLFTLPQNFRPSASVVGSYGFSNGAKNVTFAASGIVSIPIIYGTSEAGRQDFSLVFGFLAPAWIE